MMKKRLLSGLLIFFSAILLSACNSGKTEQNDDVDNTPEDRTVIEEEDSLPNYSFMIEGYVEIQEKIDKINLVDYLPNQTMYLGYESYGGENGNISYWYNVYPEDNKVMYNGQDALDILASTVDGEYTSSGYYYYDSTADCLAEVSVNKFTQQLQDVAYLIPIGKSLSIDDVQSIEDSFYLYTVHTDSQSYKDCVAVLKTDTKFTTVTYYAKGIGAVLTVSDYPNGVFDINNILTEVKCIDTDEITMENKVDSPYYANKEIRESYFFDGQRFECFETASGEDIILTIHLFTDENGNTTAYKGELSNGIEFWFEYASTENDAIIYNVDYAGEISELICYTNSSELYFLLNGEGLSNYSGMYIGLPDTVEE